MLYYLKFDKYSRQDIYYLLLDVVCPSVNLLVWLNRSLIGRWIGHAYPPTHTMEYSCRYTKREEAHRNASKGE